MKKLQQENIQEVISIRELSKAFKIYYDKPLSLKEKILHLRTEKYEDYYALKKINLSIKKGEVVGLIGKNGCGKSTLLKLMAGIIYPNDGEINVNGRLSCLIELGAGFHPDFTGRENIYTNASIFGMSKEAIDKNIADIIEFSELDEFIDNPVRTYSSGMYLKLAFSVAIHIHPEILLIDEILAVGDTNFQKKCFQRLDEIKNEGATIVIVSHDLSSLERFCSRVVWINDGVVAMDGHPLDVIHSYQEYMFNKKADRMSKHEENQKNTGSVENKKEATIEEKNKPTENYDPSGKNNWGNHEVVIEDAFIINSDGKRTNIIKSNENITIEIHYRVVKEQNGYIVGLGFYNTDGKMVFGTNTAREGIIIDKMSDATIVQISIPSIRLQAGKYYLHTSIIDKFETPLDFYRYYSEFEVITKDTSAGMFLLDRSWKVIQ